MKKNSMFKVVIATIVIAIALTWILPSSYYGESIVENGRTPVGLFDFFGYLIEAVPYYFAYVPLYILAVGGFYGVLYKTSAYRNLQDKIVSKYKGNEWIFLTIVMILFAVITSVSSLQLGLLFIFPFIISVILLMGYNKVTAALVTVGSVAAGLIGSSYAYSDMSIVNSYLELSPADNIMWKLALLIIALVILIPNVLIYAKKHKGDAPAKKFKYAESSNPFAKTWPLTIVMDLTVLVMVLGFISWKDVFTVEVFEKVTSSVLKFKIFGTEIFAKVLGNVSAFGSWQVKDLILLVSLATIVTALLTKVSFNDMLNGYVKGIKKVLKPALLVFLLYSLIIISAYNPVLLTIVKPILGKSFNVVTVSVAAFLAHLFNVELYYSASSLITYLLSLYTDNKMNGVIAVIWQATYGFAVLFVPTSVLLVTVLSGLNISYSKWIKSIWKILLEILVVILAFALIMSRFI